MRKPNINKKEILVKRTAIFLLVLMPILLILSFVDLIRRPFLGFLGYAYYAYIVICILMAFNILFWKKPIRIYRVSVSTFFSISLICLIHILVLGETGYKNFELSFITTNFSVGGYLFSLIVELIKKVPYRTVIAVLLSFSGLSLLALAFPLLKAIDKYFVKKKDSKTILNINVPDETVPIFNDGYDAEEKIEQSLPEIKEKPLTASELLFGDFSASETLGTFGGLIDNDQVKSDNSAKLLFEDTPQENSKAKGQDNYNILGKNWTSMEQMYKKWKGNDILAPIEFEKDEDRECYNPTSTAQTDGNISSENMETANGSLPHEQEESAPPDTTFLETEQFDINQFINISGDPSKKDVKPNLEQSNSIPLYEEVNITPIIDGKVELHQEDVNQSSKTDGGLFDTKDNLRVQTTTPKQGSLKEPYSAQVSIETLNIGERVSKPEELKEIVVPKDISATQTSLFDHKYKDGNSSYKVIAGNKPYVPPQIDFLKTYPGNNITFPTDYNELKQKIETTLDEFDVPAEVIGAMRGPTFTLYELKLGPGYQISKIKSLKENLKMRLEVSQLRILAPIEGKDAFGLEVPNKERDIVGLKTLVEDQEFAKGKDGIKICFGKTLQGQNFYADLAEMPHLLVAGATGTGKSVFLNSAIVSILYRYSPKEVRLILIDPKRVELSVYKGLPHLLIAETVKESSQAVNTLKWLTEEMDRRYKFFEEVGCANINQYNKFIRNPKEDPLMYRIVLVIDEMSDLMMKGKGEVESYVVRISQLARACGIHLIIATQRPVVRVITGMIKSNIISRVAFQVKSNTDSRVVLDDGGAEDLLGKGDMLYSSSSGTVRLQGALIEIDEIKKVCDYLRANNESIYSEELFNAINVKTTDAQENLQDNSDAKDDKVNEEFETLLAKVLLYFIRMGKASISSAQSAFGIGYMRGRRIVDALEQRGYLGPSTPGTQGREVLISEEEYQIEFEEEE